MSDETTTARARLFERALTDVELAAICETVAESTYAPGYVACVAFYVIAAKTLGHASVEAMAEALGGAFSASDFAIPASQWADICTLIMQRGDQLGAAGIEQVNGALDWMNRGPTGDDSIVVVSDVDDALECLDDPTGETCAGVVELRLRASDWSSWPRCERHADEREQRREQSMELYADSDVPPDWFDPLDAGESWDGE